MATKIRVGVLRGGPSNEYEISLKTGGSVLKYLPEKYHPHDIFISKDGEWHFEGVVEPPSKIFMKVDVIFNALHGEYGEDGQVQKILEYFQIPFTGSGALASALGINKVLAKRIFKAHGIPTPYYVTLEKKDYKPSLLSELFRNGPHPSVVKPVGLGSSVGVSVVKRFDELEPAILKAFGYSPKIIIEQFVRGKEATCGVVDNFRGEKIYSLLPIEIRPAKGNGFFDYSAKYGGGSEEICPGNFTKEESEKIQEFAKEAHQVLGLRHYSRSDFIVMPNGKVYILETNTLPGLTSESLLPKSLVAIGCKFPDFLDHLVTLALHS